MQILLRLLRPGLGLATLLVLTGCQTVSVQSTAEIGGPDFPPSDPAQVQILRTEPKQAHVRLGEVRAEPADENVSAEKVVEALRQAAAKLGADAAVVVLDQKQVTGAYVTGPWYGRAIQRIEGRIVVAVAIKYQ